MWLVGIAFRWLARLVNRDPDVATRVETGFWVACVLFVGLILVALLAQSFLPPPQSGAP